MSTSSGWDSQYDSSESHFMEHYSDENTTSSESTFTEESIGSHVYTSASEGGVPIVHDGFGNDLDYSSSDDSDASVQFAAQESQPAVSTQNEPTRYNFPVARVQEETQFFYAENDSNASTLASEVVALCELSTASTSDIFSRLFDVSTVGILKSTVAKPLPQSLEMEDDGVVPEDISDYLRCVSFELSRRAHGGASASFGRKVDCALRVAAAASAMSHLKKLSCLKHKEWLKRQQRTQQRRSAPVSLGTQLPHVDTLALTLLSTSELNKHQLQQLHEYLDRIGGRKQRVDSAIQSPLIEKLTEKLLPQARRAISNDSREEAALFVSAFVKFLLVRGRTRDLLCLWSSLCDIEGRIDEDTYRRSLAGWCAQGTSSLRSRRNPLMISFAAAASGRGSCASDTSGGTLSSLERLSIPLLVPQGTRVVAVAYIPKPEPTAVILTTIEGGMAILRPENSKVRESYHPLKMHSSSGAHTFEKACQGASNAVTNVDSDSSLVTLRLPTQSFAVSTETWLVHTVDDLEPERPLKISSSPGKSCVLDACQGLCGVFLKPVEIVPKNVEGIRFSLSIAPLHSLTSSSAEVVLAKIGDGAHALAVEYHSKGSLVVIRSGAFRIAKPLDFMEEWNEIQAFAFVRNGRHILQITTDTSSSEEFDAGPLAHIALAGPLRALYSDVHVGDSCPIAVADFYIDTTTHIGSDWDGSANDADDSTWTGLLHLPLHEGTSQIVLETISLSHFLFKAGMEWWDVVPPATTRPVIHEFEPSEKVIVVRNEDEQVMYCQETKVISVVCAQSNNLVHRSRAQGECQAAYHCAASKKTVFWTGAEVTFVQPALAVHLGGCGGATGSNHSLLFQHCICLSHLLLFSSEVFDMNTQTKHSLGAVDEVVKSCTAALSALDRLSVDCTSLVAATLSIVVLPIVSHIIPILDSSLLLAALSSLALRAPISTLQESVTEHVRWLNLTPENATTVFEAECHLLEARKAGAEPKIPCFTILKNISALIPLQQWLVDRDQRLLRSATRSLAQSLTHTHSPHLERALLTTAAAMLQTGPESLTVILETIRSLFISRKEYVIGTITTLLTMLIAIRKRFSFSGQNIQDIYAFKELANQMDGAGDVRGSQTLTRRLRYIVPTFVEKSKMIKVPLLQSFRLKRVRFEFSSTPSQAESAKIFIRIVGGNLEASMIPIVFDDSPVAEWDSTIEGAEVSVVVGTGTFSTPLAITAVTELHIQDVAQSQRAQLTDTCLRVSELVSHDILSASLRGPPNGFVPAVFRGGLRTSTDPPISPFCAALAGMMPMPDDVEEQWQHIYNDQRRSSGPRFIDHARQKLSGLCKMLTAVLGVHLQCPEASLSSVFDAYVCPRWMLLMDVDQNASQKESFISRGKMLLSKYCPLAEVLPKEEVSSCIFDFLYKQEVELSDVDMESVLTARSRLAKSYLVVIGSGLWSGSVLSLLSEPTTNEDGSVAEQCHFLSPLFGCGPQLEEAVRLSVMGAIASEFSTSRLADESLRTRLLAALTFPFESKDWSIISDHVAPFLELCLSGVSHRSPGLCPDRGCVLPNAFSAGQEIHVRSEENGLIGLQADDSVVNLVADHPWRVPSSIICYFEVKVVLAPSSLGFGIGLMPRRKRGDDGIVLLNSGKLTMHTDISTFSPGSRVGDIVGCGILTLEENGTKVSRVFFTENGAFMGCARTPWSQSLAFPFVFAESSATVQIQVNFGTGSPFAFNVLEVDPTRHDQAVGAGLVPELAHWVTRSIVMRSQSDQLAGQPLHSISSMICRVTEVALTLRESDSHMQSLLARVFPIIDRLIADRSSEVSFAVAKCLFQMIMSNGSAVEEALPRFHRFLNQHEPVQVSKLFFENMGEKGVPLMFAHLIAMCEKQPDIVKFQTKWSDDSEEVSGCGTYFSKDVVPRTKKIRIGVRIQRDSRTTGGSSLGGCYYVGLSAVRRQFSNIQDILATEGAYLLQDADDRDQMKNMRISQGAFPLNSQRRIFGHNDDVFVEFDPDVGSISFYRGNTPLGVAYQGVSTEHPLYVMAYLFNADSRCTMLSVSGNSASLIDRASVFRSKLVGVLQQLHAMSISADISSFVRTQISMINTTTTLVPADLQRVLSTLGILGGESNYAVCTHATHGRVHVDKFVSENMCSVIVEATQRSASVPVSSLTPTTFTLPIYSAEERATELQMLSQTLENTVFNLTTVSPLENEEVQQRAVIASLEDAASQRMHCDVVAFFNRKNVPPTASPSFVRRSGVLPAASLQGKSSQLASIVCPYLARGPGRVAALLPTSSGSCSLVVQAKRFPTCGMLVGGKVSLFRRSDTDCVDKGMLAKGIACQISIGATESTLTSTNNAQSTFHSRAQYDQTSGGPVCLYFELAAEDIVVLAGEKETPPRNLVMHNIPTKMGSSPCFVCSGTASFRSVNSETTFICQSCFYDWRLPRESFFDHRRCGKLLSLYPPQVVSGGDEVMFLTPSAAKISQHRSVNVSKRSIDGSCVALRSDAFVVSEPLPSFGVARADFSIRTVLTRGRCEALTSGLWYSPSWRDSSRHQLTLDCGAFCCSNMLPKKSHWFSVSVSFTSEEILWKDYEICVGFTTNSSLRIGAKSDVDVLERVDQNETLPRTTILSRLSKDTRQWFQAANTADIYCAFDAEDGCWYVAPSLSAMSCSPVCLGKLPSSSAAQMFFFTSDVVSVRLLPGMIKEGPGASLVTAMPSLALIPSSLPVEAAPDSMFLIPDLEESRARGWTIFSPFGGDLFLSGEVITVTGSHNDRLIHVYSDGVLIAQRDIQEDFVNVPLRIVISLPMPGLIATFENPSMARRAIGRVMTCVSDDVVVIEENNGDSLWARRSDLMLLAPSVTSATPPGAAVCVLRGDHATRGTLESFRGEQTSVHLCSGRDPFLFNSCDCFDIRNEEYADAPLLSLRQLEISEKRLPVKFDVGRRVGEPRSASYNGLMFDCVSKKRISITEIGVCTDVGKEVKFSVYFKMESMNGAELNPTAWRQICEHTVHCLPGSTVKLPLHTHIIAEKDVTFSLYINSNSNCGVAFFCPEDRGNLTVGSEFDCDEYLVVCAGRKSESAQPFMDIPRDARGFAGYILYTPIDAFSEPLLRATDDLFTNNKYHTQSTEVISVCRPLKTKLSRSFVITIDVVEQCSLRTIEIPVMARQGCSTGGAWRFPALLTIYHTTANAIDTNELTDDEQFEGDDWTWISASRMLLDITDNELLLKIPHCQLERGRNYVGVAMMCPGMAVVACDSSQYVVKDSVKSIRGFAGKIGIAPHAISDFMAASFKTGSRLVQTGTTSYNGLMFDISASCDVVIDEVFFVSETQSSNVACKLFFREGSCEGFIRSQNQWREVRSAILNLQDNAEYSLGTLNLTLKAGVRYALYINTANSSGLRFYSGSDGLSEQIGSEFDSDGVLTVFVGRQSESGVPFASINLSNARGLKGRIAYRKPKATGSSREIVVSPERALLLGRVFVCISVMLQSGIRIKDLSKVAQSACFFTPPCYSWLFSAPQAKIEKMLSQMLQLSESMDPHRVPVRLPCASVEQVPTADWPVWSVGDYALNTGAPAGRDVVKISHLDKVKSSFLPLHRALHSGRPMTFGGSSLHGTPHGSSFTATESSEGEHNLPDVDDDWIVAYLTTFIEGISSTIPAESYAYKLLRGEDIIHASGVHERIRAEHCSVFFDDADIAVFKVPVAVIVSHTATTVTTPLVWHPHMKDFFGLQLCKIRPSLNIDIQVVSDRSLRLPDGTSEAENVTIQVLAPDGTLQYVSKTCMVHHTGGSTEFSCSLRLSEGQCTTLADENGYVSIRLLRTARTVPYPSSAFSQVEPFASMCVWEGSNIHSVMASDGKASVLLPTLKQLMDKPPIIIEARNPHSTRGSNLFLSATLRMGPASTEVGIAPRETLAIYSTHLGGAVALCVDENGDRSCLLHVTPDALSECDDARVSVTPSGPLVELLVQPASDRIIQVLSSTRPIASHASKSAPQGWEIFNSSSVASSGDKVTIRGNESGQCVLGPVTSGDFSWKVRISRGDLSPGSGLGGGHFAGIAISTFDNLKIHYDAVKKTSGLFLIQDTQDEDSQPQQLPLAPNGDKVFGSDTELSFSINASTNTLSLSIDGAPAKIVFEDLPAGVAWRPAVRLDHKLSSARIEQDSLLEKLSVNIPHPTQNTIPPQNSDMVDVLHRFPAFEEFMSCLDPTVQSQLEIIWKTQAFVSHNALSDVPLDLRQKLYEFSSLLESLSAAGAFRGEALGRQFFSPEIVEQAVRVAVAREGERFLCLTKDAIVRLPQQALVAASRVSTFGSTTTLPLKWFDSSIQDACLILLPKNIDCFEMPNQSTSQVVTPHECIMHVLCEVNVSSRNHRAFVVDGSHFIPLSTVFELKLNLSFASRLEIITGMFCALEHIHLHRRTFGVVSPANIFVNLSSPRKPQVKLWSVYSYSTLDSSSVRLAPEVISSAALSPESDTWAAAAVAFQLFSASYSPIPVHTTKGDSLTNTEKNDFVQQFSPKVYELLSTALSPNPHNRPSMTDFLNELEDCVVDATLDLPAAGGKAKDLSTGTQISGVIASYNGIMFDIVAKKMPVTVAKIRFFSDTTSAAHVTAFAKDGTFIDSEVTEAKWSKVFESDCQLTSGGECSVDFSPPLRIGAFQRGAVFIHTNNSNGLFFFSESAVQRFEMGDVVEENADIGITTGKKCESSAPFHRLSGKRYFRGTVVYDIVAPKDARRSPLFVSGDRPKVLAPRADVLRRGVVVSSDGSQMVCLGQHACDVEGAEWLLVCGGDSKERWLRREDCRDERRVDIKTALTAREGSAGPSSTFTDNLNPVSSDDFGAHGYSYVSQGIQRSGLVCVKFGSDARSECCLVNRHNRIVAQPTTNAPVESWTIRVDIDRGAVLDEQSGIILCPVGPDDELRVLTHEAATITLRYIVRNGNVSLLSSRTMCVAIETPSQLPLEAATPCHKRMRFLWTDESTMMTLIGQPDDDDDYVVTIIAADDQTAVVGPVTALYGIPHEISLPPAFRHRPLRVIVELPDEDGAGDDFAKPVLTFVGDSLISLHGSCGFQQILTSPSIATFEPIVREHERHKIRIKVYSPSVGRLSIGLAPREAKTDVTLWSIENATSPQFPPWTEVDITIDTALRVASIESGYESARRDFSSILKEMRLVCSSAMLGATVQIVSWEFRSSLKKDTQSGMWQRLPQLFDRFPSPHFIRGPGAPTRHAPARLEESTFPRDFSGRPEAVGQLCQTYVSMSAAHLVHKNIGTLVYLNPFSDEHAIRLLASTSASSRTQATRGLVSELHPANRMSLMSHAITILGIPDSVESSYIDVALSILGANVPQLCRFTVNQSFASTIFSLLCRTAALFTGRTRQTALTIVCELVEGATCLPPPSFLKQVTRPVVLIAHALFRKNRPATAVAQLVLRLIGSHYSFYRRLGYPLAEESLIGYRSAIGFPIVLCATDIVSALLSNKALPLAVNLIKGQQLSRTDSLVADQFVISFEENVAVRRGVRVFEVHLSADRHGDVIIDWGMVDNASDDSVHYVGITVEPNGHYTSTGNGRGSSGNIGTSATIVVTCNYYKQEVSFAAISNRRKHLTTHRAGFRCATPRVSVRHGEDAIVAAGLDAMRAIEHHDPQAVSLLCVCGGDAEKAAKMHIEHPEEDDTEITPKPLEFYQECVSLIDRFTENKIEENFQRKKINIPHRLLASLPRLADLSLAGDDEESSDISPLLLYLQRIQCIESFTEQLFPLVEGVHEGGPMSQVWSILKTLATSRTRDRITSHVLQTIPRSDAAPVGVRIHLLQSRPRADRNRMRTLTSSVFFQLYEQLSQFPGMTYTRAPLFKVSLVGQGAIDAGGPYREVLTRLGEELMTPHPSGEFMCNPLFRLCESSMTVFPAALTGASDQQRSMLEFFGNLLGYFLVSNDVLPCDFPDLFWATLIGEVRNHAMLADVCPALVNWLHPDVLRDTIESNDFEDLESSFPDIRELFIGIKNDFGSSEIGIDAQDTDSLTSTPQLSQATTPEMKPRGSKSVYDILAEKLESRLLATYEEPVKIIRRGFTRVIPERILSGLFRRDVELRVCGNADVTLEALKIASDTKNLPASLCEDFWRIVGEMSNDERALLLQFSTGQRRFPLKQRLVIEYDANLRGFPRGSTCFYKLTLPKTSSSAQLSYRLLYAISNTVTIDLDNDADGPLHMEI